MANKFLLNHTCDLHHHFVGALHRPLDVSFSCICIFILSSGWPWLLLVSTSFGVVMEAFSSDFKFVCLALSVIAPPSRNLLIARIVSMAACSVLLALKFFFTTGRRSVS